MHTLRDSAVFDTALEDYRASMAFADTGVTADVLTQTAAQCALAAVDVSQFAASVAASPLGASTNANADSALDRVVEVLRTVEGRMSANVRWVCTGFASAEFAHLVRDAVKAKLKVEKAGLVIARLVGKTARDMALQDFVDRFVENAVATVETTLGLVYRAVEAEWRPVARADVTGGENYVHLDMNLTKKLGVRKKGKEYYLRYDVDDIVYGNAKASNVVVLVFLAGEKTVRVEILAKSVAGIPARFEEVEWGGGKWIRLATAWIGKPGNLEHYVTRIEPRVVGQEVEVNTSRILGLDSLAGLMLTDTSGGIELDTPDPLLLKYFSLHFEKVRLKGIGVALTETGLTLVLRAIALDDKPFKELLGDIAERYGVGLRKLLDEAKGMAVDVMTKLSNDIVRTTEEVAQMSRRDGVEAGRRALLEGLKRLFEEKEREAFNVGRCGEALAVAVAGRLLLKAVESPMGWLSLLVGDGVVNIARKRLGFSAKPAEVAEAVLRLLAVWAGAYGAKVKVRGNMAEYTSVSDVEKVLRAVLVGEALEFALSLVKSWNGLASSHAPKLVSLLALAQLLSVVEGKWAVELWLAHKATTTPTPPAVTEILGRVKGIDKMEWTKRGGEVYFKYRCNTMKESPRVATLRLHTDFANFRLYCGSHSGASARDGLEVIAKELGIKPKWHWDALVLPADVGWSMFLRLWARHNMSLTIRDGGRELLRVEVLEARADGTAKFRLWYYKWRETRPDRPYVDIEITYKGEKRGFVDYVYANEAMGILREHLAEIAKLLKSNGVKGVAYYEYGKSAYLRFTGAFRDSVFSRLGISPELPRGEPPAVKHLGGLRFKVGDREVEFGPKAVGARRELYAELTFPSRDEAERFVSSLMAIGVYAEVRGNTVRLDSDSFFGLLVTTGTVPPGLTPLYRSEDLHVYAGAEDGRMRFYFAVKHKGVWRVVEGLYNEKLLGVMLARTERDVLEAVRDAVAKTLEMLGRPAEVGEPREKLDKKGDVETYYLYLYGPHITPFLEHATKDIKAEPAEVRLEGRRITARVSGVEVVVEFKLLKRNETAFLMVADMGQTLALYKSLKALGVPAEITPRGIKIDGKAMWALAATAVERSELSRLPAEVMTGIELLKVYSASNVKIYIFRTEGAHYYFAVKTKDVWRVAGGKYDGKRTQIIGEVAPTIAEAINAIYSEMGVERRVKMRRDKKGVLYIQLTNVDLELLRLK